MEHFIAVSEPTADQARLTAGDWIASGLSLLAERGVDKMRIVDIADSLGVTKGSFYWHFRDRKEFLRSLAEQWSSKGTTDRLETIRAATVDAHERLRLVRMQGRDLAPTDRAMREWSRQDPDVAAAVAQADQQVHEFLKQCFLDIGFDAVDADLRARTLLYAFIGQYLVRLEEGTGADASERLVALLVAPSSVGETVRR